MCTMSSVDLSIYFLQHLLENPMINNITGMFLTPGSTTCSKTNTTPTAPWEKQITLTNKCFPYKTEPSKLIRPSLKLNSRCICASIPPVTCLRQVTCLRTGCFLVPFPSTDTAKSSSTLRMTLSHGFGRPAFLLFSGASSPAIVSTCISCPPSQAVGTTSLHFAAAVLATAGLSFNPKPSL